MSFPAPGWFGRPVSELPLAFMHLKEFTLEQDSQFQCFWCEMATAWPHFCTAFPFCHFQEPFFLFFLRCLAGYLVWLHFRSWFCFLKQKFCKKWNQETLLNIGVEEERITWSRNTKQERRLQDSVWDGAWTCGCSACELRHLENNLPDTFLMGWGRPRQHKLSEEEWTKHKAMTATKTEDFWAAGEEAMTSLNCRGNGSLSVKLVPLYLHSCL